MRPCSPCGVLLMARSLDISSRGFCRQLAACVFSWRHWLAWRATLQLLAAWPPQDSVPAGALQVRGVWAASQPHDNVHCLLSHPQRAVCHL